jgi:phage terminase large subunit-like protein
MQYMLEMQERMGLYFKVEELSHGNRNKADRIEWALAGRADKGRIQLNPGEWNNQFLSQAADFPSPLAHDDLIDAVAYIDQIATPWYEETVEEFEEWAPLDMISGY